MAESKRETRWGWFAISALGIGVIYFARSILVPFLIALLLAYTFDPMITFLERRRIRRFLAIWFLLTLLFAGVVLFLFVIIPIIQKELTLALEQIPRYLQYLQTTLLPALEHRFGLSIPKTFEEVSAALLPRLKEEGATIVQPLTALVGSLFSNTARLFGALVNLIVIPFAFYYFLSDFDRIKKVILAYIPPRYQEEAKKRFEEIDRSLSGFIRGQLLIILFLAILYGIGLRLIGLDLALILGILSAVGEIVPYVGFTVGLSLSALVGFLQFQDLLHPFYILLLFAAIQSIQGMVIAPWVMGHQVGLRPLVVIAAIYIGGDLFGFIGILLAIPGAAVGVVLLKTLGDAYRRSSLYTGN
ncbi:MAG: AI-2E family transporter [Candidatus Manganitrophaceae bacterium]